MVVPFSSGRDPRRQAYALGLAYVGCILALAAALNWFSFHPGGFSDLTLDEFLAWGTLWGGFFLPVLMLPKLTGWSLRSFGVSLNQRALVTGLGVFLLLAPLATRLRIPLPIQENGAAGLIEALAGTGEEIFFRGFLYALLLQVLQGRRWAPVWAVFLSSLAYALVQTQVFLPDYGFGFWQVLLAATFLGCLRSWTGSILPGIIVHCALEGGMLSVLAAVLGYLLLAAWAHDRGEEVWLERGSPPV